MADGGPGPREGSGEACLKEGVGEWSEGEPEESVDALNGLSGFSCGRRIGSGPGRDGRSEPMLSLRSLVFGVGKTDISKREEVEEWLEAPPESAATPARLT